MRIIRPIKNSPTALDERNGDEAGVDLRPVSKRITCLITTLRLASGWANPSQKQAISNDDR